MLVLLVPILLVLIMLVPILGSAKTKDWGRRTLIFRSRASAPLRGCTTWKRQQNVCFNEKHVFQAVSGRITSFGLAAPFGGPTAKRCGATVHDATILANSVLAKYCPRLKMPSSWQRKVSVSFSDYCERKSSRYNDIIPLLVCRSAGVLTSTVVLCYEDGALSTDRASNAEMRVLE